jgi:putative phosphoesterase
MSARSEVLRVGLISDTHGLLRPEALEVLRGSDCIIHAGDIGDPEILKRLAGLAPLTAVRGNNDRGADYADVPETAVLEAGGVRILVLHDLAELAFDRQAAGYQAVISGHSHRPRCEERAGVLYVNPGSAGPRRFSLPVSVGRLLIEAGRLRAELVELSIAAAPRVKAARRR